MHRACMLTAGNCSLFRVWFLGRSSAGMKISPKPRLASETPPLTENQTSQRLRILPTSSLMINQLLLITRRHLSARGRTSECHIRLAASQRRITHLEPTTSSNFNQAFASKLDSTNSSQRNTFPSYSHHDRVQLNCCPHHRCWPRYVSELPVIDPPTHYLPARYRQGVGGDIPLSPKPHCHWKRAG